MIVSQPQLTLVVNDTFSLNALVLPTGVDASVLWTSSDESVVTIDENGRITAEGVGTAVITAKAKADTSKTAVCKVTVVPEGEGIPATSITLSAKVLNLGVGETKLLSVTVSPDSAVMPELIWASGDESIVRVYNGNIIGIREGSAMVTVSTVTGGLTDSCRVTVSPRTGIEGNWQSYGPYYVITADTITTGSYGVTGFVPNNLYTYTKSGNETKGTVTVTLQSIWNNADNKWYTVDEHFEVMIKQIQESMSGSLRDFVASMGGGDLSLFISTSKDMATEMEMTFDESNLTEANLDKPVPQDVQNLYTAYANKFFTAQKKEEKKPRTYEYEVADNPGNGPMIQFTGMYDTTKKWFEQTEGQFSNGSGVNFDPQGKRLSIWDKPTEIRFSSVTETELTERDSGNKWTALWDENALTLTLTDPNKVPYKLAWSGYSL